MVPASENPGEHGGRAGWIASSDLPGRRSCCHTKQRKLVHAMTRVDFALFIKARKAVAMSFNRNCNSKACMAICPAPIRSAQPTLISGVLCTFQYRYFILHRYLVAATIQATIPKKKKKNLITRRRCGSTLGSRYEHTRSCLYFRVSCRVQ